MAKIYLTFHRGIRDVRFGAENLAALRALGQVKLNERERAPATDELIQEASDCDVILGERTTAAEAALFDNAPGLVAFVRSVQDLRQVDIEAASRNGVLVANVRPTFIAAVVEWVIGQMINLGRWLPDFISTYHAGREPDLALGAQGKQLAGKTAGIIGFGQLGRELGRLLTAMHMQVVAYDPYVAEWPDHVQSAPLDTLLAESDFVICLAKHTPETEGMINQKVFGRMKASAFFINASRGGLVDETALEEALDARRFAGAALDVGHGPGDVPPLRLGRRSDVYATPHVAAGFEANLEQGRAAVEAVRTVLEGRVPETALNAEHARRLARFRCTCASNPGGNDR